MFTKFLNATQVFVFASALLLTTGCNKITIITGEESDPSNPNPGKTTLVTFNASIEGRNHLTRGVSAMGEGIQSRLFAFDSSQTSSEEVPEAEGLYITSSPGTLQGDKGYKMYLSNGTYDFYAVSDNFSTIPPRFQNGKSEPLFNSIDYLWWNAANQDIISTQTNIPIIYLHAATQVVFEVIEGDSIKLDKLISAMITPPLPGASMDLLSGIIPPATTYDRADKMGINGSLAQYIMLPLKTDSPMTLTLDVMVNGERNPRTYNVSVPVPSGELKPGDSYLFKTILNENSVTFPTVSIKDWTEVDETGNPLYPNQK